MILFLVMGVGELPVCPAFPLWFLVGPGGGGWSGAGGGQGVVQGAAEQFVEAGFPGPVLGQVEHEAPRGAGDAGGDVDQVGAQGGAAGAGVQAQPARAPAARVRL